ncbi:hypothetical protein WA026_022446 [Henosepilachna vigintioctopunctata]|uniref:LAGLIDADG homing endonuclease n=1 Tax=Henosepilachna vigintioctopunctata TaxID=420089 RepID=A0AAW1UGU7_9CUCU
MFLTVSVPDISYKFITSVVYENTKLVDRNPNHIGVLWQNYFTAFLALTTSGTDNHKENPFDCYVGNMKFKMVFESLDSIGKLKKPSKTQVQRDNRSNFISKLYVQCQG